MIKIIDNYLETNKFEYIESILMGSDFPWFYQSTVSKVDDNKEFYFNHTLYFNSVVTSHLFQSIMTEFLERLNPKQLLRSKVNCFLRSKEHFKFGKHIDTVDKHNVALWYANTNNGKTVIIENGKEEIIDNIKNRMVIFDGSLEHYPISQTDTKTRVNLNINYVPI
jgi:hypothetical protein